MNALHRGSFLAFAFFFVALSSSVSWSRPLTPAERTEFEQSFFATCIQKPNRRADVIGFGGTESDYASYCRCVGKYFARTIYYGQQHQAPGQDNAAFKYCIRQVLGKSVLTLTREKMEREILRQINSAGGGAFDDPVWRRETVAYKRCVARNLAHLIVQEEDVGLLEPGSTRFERDKRAIFVKVYQICQRHRRPVH